MKKILIFLGIAAISLIFHYSIYAQVVPDKREIKLVINPGQETKGSLNLENLSDRDETIKAYFEDFIYSAPYAGIKKFHPLGTLKRTCGKWISIFPENFILPAKTKQQVSYTIKIPKEAKGGYYALLFFERGSAEPAGEKGIGLVVRTGVSFFLETFDATRKGEIKEIIAEKGAISGTLLNSGNVALISQGTFNIIDKKGMIFDRGNIKKFYLPEQEQAKFTVNVTDKLPVGSFTLVINFDLEGGKPIIKEVDFSKDKAGNLKILKITD